MHLTIVTIGQPKLSFAKEGFAEYMKRLGGFHKVSVNHIKDDAQAKKKMLLAAGQGTVIALDEKGKLFDSKGLSTWLESFSTQGENHLVFLIGGPDGLSDAVRQSAHHTLALSPMTLPHDLAMLFFAEALYRASTISAGHPYHRN